MALEQSEISINSAELRADARRKAIARAHALVPALRSRASETDKERRIPEQTIAELLDADLFGVLKPRRFGGLEAGVAALVEVTAELAAGCGSTGWVYGVLAGHSWLINLFPAEAQAEVFADPRALTATVFRFGGEITPAPGGYRLVNGSGKFCSGIDHASWVIIGNAVVTEDAPPEPRFFVLPSHELEVIDDWHTVGMRGTGSRSIRVAETFIPAHRSVPVEALIKGTSPGAEMHRAPLYRTPFQLVAPFSIIGAPLGIARGAVGVYSEGLGRYTAGLDEIERAALGATFGRTSHAAAEIDAAYSLVLDDAEYIDGLDDPSSLDSLDRARLPRNWAYAAQTSREAVTRLFSASGGGAVFDGSEIQRFWRDVNAAAQHYAFVWDNAMSDYGRVLLGLEPMNTIPGKRRRS